MSAVERILAERVLCIVRVDEPPDELARGLLDGGVGVLEVSLVSHGALDAIARWRERFPQLAVGAGTVVDSEGCRLALAAGAEFLVAPGHDAGVAAAAREAGVAYIPGALTPTEVQRCLAGGAPLVKLFPAGWAGPEYVRDLLGPFPDARLLPTGGIDAGNAAAFFDAGAAAVAVGSSLVNARSTYESVRSQAGRLLGAIRAPQKGDARDAA